jgi:P27 family predicted phage terminase small subunit
MVSRKKTSPANQQIDSVPTTAAGTLVEKVECPPELGPAARQEWDRVAPHLLAAGRLTALDRGMLAVYCAAYAGWIEAVLAIQTYGAVMKSPSGYPMQSPYVSIAMKNADTMARIASEFGFTPASRNRLPWLSKIESQFPEAMTLEELGASLLPLK